MKLSQAFPGSIVLSGLLLMGIGAGLGGCKERVVDVDTPLGSVKVDRDKQSGAVDVDVDVKRKNAPRTP